jgi:CBS domain-containing protein
LICPVCRFGNFPGDDTCANCGADLWNLDTPESVTSFRGKLLGMHLDALGGSAPHVVDVATPVDDALATMRRDGVDCLLLTDGGVLVGIFTDRDAILKLAGRATAGRTMAEVMTHDPVVLRSGDPVAVAIHKMAVGGFRHVPIVSDGVPVGVVSARDVFRHLATDLG